ncbi:T9SS type A sorting domain-containing protein [Hymenobacter sp. BT175]|uniref:T9SS type A sorting domain-containing protein n=1 Tax=Hymenobacter translucens TaxID=2886507 RepID=UPI001D0DF1A3|nr:T9SS type A sorting domain-containing protein [Hymenobacter translucens]MCC2547457.1 T9SS type A sorting domain-containing protein [Hymenobacter translucens]
MKKTITLLSLLALAVPALAQSPITLTQATFPASASTVERYQNASLPAGLGAPAMGSNQSWDYRALMPSGSAYNQLNLSVPPSPSFAGAQWTRANTSTIGNMAYVFTTYFTLAPTGRMALGRGIIRQPYSIATRTGGANDSIVINRQTVPYGGAGGIADFPLPLTAGSRSLQTYRFGVTGTITVAAAGLNRAPFRIVQRYIYVDSVAGWGTLRIPFAGRAAGSDPLPVLMVRSRTIRQDSLYLNGSPAPASLLAALNLTQGSFTSFYLDHFWRTGSAQPLLELYYPNRQYASPFSAAYSTENDLLLATQATSALAAGWKAWPNPLGQGEDLQLALPRAADQPAQLTLRDALGRTILSQALQLQNGSGTLPAAATQALRPGLYTLTVQQGSHQATFKLLRP